MIWVRSERRHARHSTPDRHRHRCFRRHCLGVLLAVLLQLSAVETLKLRIDGIQECFSQNVQQKSYVTGSFVSVASKGLLTPRASYNLQVINPQQRVIHAVADRAQAKFSFKARFVGSYRFCLEASDSISTALLHHGPRFVLFEVHTSHTIARYLGAGNSRSEPLWQLLDTVEADLTDMKSLQQYFHNREIRNRDTVALFQVGFIRRLFDRSKRHHSEV